MNLHRWGYCLCKDEGEERTVGQGKQDECPETLQPILESVVRAITTLPELGKVWDDGHEEAWFLISDRHDRRAKGVLRPGCLSLRDIERGGYRGPFASAYLCADTVSNGALPCDSKKCRGESPQVAGTFRNWCVAQALRDSEKLLGCWPMQSVTLWERQTDLEVSEAGGYLQLQLAKGA